MKEKNYTKRTAFDLWLEKCPLEPIEGKTWSFTEREYTDHTQVTIRFRVPKQKKELHYDS